MKARPFLTLRAARNYVRKLRGYEDRYNIDPLMHVEISHGRVDSWERVDPDD